MTEPPATGSRAATYPEMDDSGRKFRIVPNTGPGGGQYIRDYEPHATSNHALCRLGLHSWRLDSPRWHRCARCGELRHFPDGGHPPPRPTR